MQRIPSVFSLLFSLLSSIERWRANRDEGTAYRVAKLAVPEVSGVCFPKLAIPQIRLSTSNQGEEIESEGGKGIKNLQSLEMQNN